MDAPPPSKVSRITERMQLPESDLLYHKLYYFAATIDDFWNIQIARTQHRPKIRKLGEVADAYWRIIYSHGANLHLSVQGQHAIAPGTIMWEIAWICRHYQDAVTKAPWLNASAYCQTTIGDLHVFAWACSRALPANYYTMFHQTEADTAYVTAWNLALDLPGIDLVHLATFNSIAWFVHDVLGFPDEAREILRHTFYGAKNSMKVRRLSESQLPVGWEMVLRMLRNAWEAWQTRPSRARNTQPDWNTDCPIQNISPPLLRMVYLMSLVAPRLLSL